MRRTLLLFVFLVVGCRLPADREDLKLLDEKLPVPEYGDLYFRARDSRGSELWRSDGTNLGTRLVRDVFPGPNGSRPRSLANVGGVLYFSARDGVHGFELWKAVP